MWLRDRVATTDEGYVVVTATGAGPDGPRVVGRGVTLGDGRVAVWPTAAGAGAALVEGAAVTVQPCDRHGVPTPTATPTATSGVATVVRSGRGYDEAVARVRAAHRLRARWWHPPETLLLVDPTSPPAPAPAP